MTTAPKLVPPQKKALDPRLKSWIDNVIVPTLVQEYLACEKKTGEASAGDAAMLQSTDTKASTEGGQ